MFGKKRQNKELAHSGIWQNYSDMALLMLGMFMFLLVTILLTSRFQQEVQVPKLKAQLKELQAELAAVQRDKDRMRKDLGALGDMQTRSQTDRVLVQYGLDHGQGRKDFDLFVQGLKGLPGTKLHLVVDATGSMHGLTSFLVPILRVIVLRSGKDLDAITWFSDGRAQTYRGSMGDMLDHLMSGAPFVGIYETIGDAFYRAAKNAPVPGAYLLIGDEASDDRIYYKDIPAPVYTLPLGHNNPTTVWEYQNLAEKTGGKMLQMVFQ